MAISLTVADLLETHRFPDSALYSGRVIAKDSMTDRILFDTRKNTDKTIRSFYSGVIVATWSEVRPIYNNSGYSSAYEPVLMCYIRHNSWEGDVENKK